MITCCKIREYNLYVSILFINIRSPLYIGNYTVIEYKYGKSTNHKSKGKGKLEFPATGSLSLSLSRAPALSLSMGHLWTFTM